MKSIVALTGLWAIGLVAPLHCSGCIWDSDTLADERKKSPDRAALILGTHQPIVDTNGMSKRIDELKAKPRHNDPAWWNDLAGAHLRLGQASEAAKLLEPLLSRFPDDYGIHANLGTAYHLLGRYTDAEREIARDLELNPKAHFDLEVYHLALLQYLSRGKDYQLHHVFVDEFTPAFLQARIMHLDPTDGLATNSPAPASHIEALKEGLAAETNSYKRQELLVELVSLDPPPAYRYKWNLSEHPNFERGVGYMAELNPKQPACFVMLGLACLHAGDMNLGSLAFERAIALGSPQRQFLEAHIAQIRDHIRQAGDHRRQLKTTVGLAVFVLSVVGVFCVWFLLKVTRR